MSGGRGRKGRCRPGWDNRVTRPELTATSKTRKAAVGLFGQSEQRRAKNDFHTKSITCKPLSDHERN